MKKCVTVVKTKHLLSEGLCRLDFWSKSSLIFCRLFDPPRFNLTFHETFTHVHRSFRTSLPKSRHKQPEIKKLFTERFAKRKVIANGFLLLSLTGTNGKRYAWHSGKNS